MPTVAQFNGVKVEFFFDDHPPPHFHASFAEFAARIDIGAGRVISGRLPPDKMRVLRIWMLRHKAELRAAWEAARQGGKPRKIDG
jgi:hypothetical protein